MGGGGGAKISAISICLSFVELECAFEPNEPSLKAAKNNAKPLAPIGLRASPASHDRPPERWRPADIAFVFCARRAASGPRPEARGPADQFQSAGALFSGRDPIII